MRVCIPVLLGCLAVAADDSIVQIHTQEGGISTECAKCNEYWGMLQIGAGGAPQLRTVWAAPSTGGCGPDLNNSVANITNGPSLAGAAVLFIRGPCLFSAMVDAAAYWGAAAVFVLNMGNKSAVVPAASNGSYAGFSSPVCMLGRSAAAQLGNGSVAGTAATITVYDPQYAVLDASAALFVAVALGVLTVGSLWNTHHERERLDCRPRAARSINDAGNVERSEDQQLMTRGMVGFFVVFASCFLLLLYFFYKYLIYVLLGGFALFGALSVYEHLAAVLYRTPAWRQTVDLPWSPQTPWPAAVAAAAAVGLSVAWVVTRDQSFSWVLQDVLGVAILVTMVRVVTIPNLKIATGLLCCLLVYDVFFVFITPLITPDGSSVMVNAATGNQTQVDANGCQSYSNMMPFLLRVPALSRPPCTCPHYSMLGFGDVALPGFVVAMTLRFDYALAINQGRKKSFLARYSYFLTTLSAYVVGLLSAFIAASQMATAQPALLYLSPAVLLSIWIPGWLRGHLAHLKDLESFLGYAAATRSGSISPGAHDDEATEQLLGNDSDDSDA